MKKQIKELINYISYNQSKKKTKNGKFLIAQQKRLAKRIKKNFDKQKSYFTQEIKILFEENSIKKNVFKQENDKIEFILDNIPEREEMMENIQETIRIAMLRGGKNIVRELKLGTYGISFNLDQKEAINYLDNYRRDQISNYRGNLNSNTRNKIKEIIKEGIDKREGYGIIAERIIEQGEVGVFSYSRAEMIAVRESGMAFEYGNRVPVLELEDKYPDIVVIKRWITVGDEIVTPTHRQNASEGFIPNRQAFAGTGDQHPPASDNVRCRCSIEYRIQ